MAGENTLSSYIQALRANQQQKNVYSNIGRSLMTADVSDPADSAGGNFAANFAKALGAGYLGKLGRDENNAYDSQINDVFSAVLQGQVPTGDEDIVRAANVFKLNNDFARAQKATDLQDEITKAVLVARAGRSDDLAVENVKGQNALIQEAIKNPRSEYSKRILEQAGLGALIKPEAVVTPGEVVGPGMSVQPTAEVAAQKPLVAAKPQFPFKSKEQKILEGAGKALDIGLGDTAAVNASKEGLSNESNLETTLSKSAESARNKASEIGNLAATAEPLIDMVGNSGQFGPLQAFSNISTKVGANLGSESAKKRQAGIDSLQQMVALMRQAAREPGEGTTTNAEGDLYANFLTSMNSTPAGNKLKVEMAKTFAKQNNDFSNFYNFYTSGDGAGTVEGLQEVWDYYKKENPYVLPAPTEGGAITNPTRQDFREVDLPALLQRGRANQLKPAFDLKAIAATYQQKYGAKAKSKFANDYGPIIDKMGL